MNRKILIALLAGVVFLGGCIKDPVKLPRLLLTKWTYVGQGTYKYDYDSQLRLTISSYLPLKGAVSIKRYSEFNADGAAMYYDHQYVGSPAGLSQYRPEYDALGRLTHLRTYDVDNNFVQLVTFTYLSTGIEQFNYAATGVLALRVFYFINAAGNITSTEYFNNAGVLLQRRTFSLFDDQKSSKWLLPSLEGRELYSENNYRAHSVYDAATGITENFTCTYEYNASGYVTRRSSTNTATGNVAVQTFEYVTVP